MQEDNHQSLVFKPSFNALVFDLIMLIKSDGKRIPIKYKIPNNLFAFDKLHSRDEQFLLPDIPHVVINCLVAQKQLK